MDCRVGRYSDIVLSRLQREKQKIIDNNLSREQGRQVICDEIQRIKEDLLNGKLKVYGYKSLNFDYLESAA